jgi:hypothetical protein
MMLVAAVAPVVDAIAGGSESWRQDPRHVPVSGPESYDR